MDQGQVIGLVITVVAAVALAAGLFWLLVFGRRNEWPEGVRIEQRVSDILATVIWAPGAGGRTTVAVAAARAAHAADLAWRELKGPSKALAGLRHVAVWILPDAEFERLAAKTLVGEVSNVSAWLEYVPRRLGHGPPLAIVRASLQDHLASRGQPCIHEFLHAVGLIHDRSHKDETVWAKQDDVVQVEERAQRIFDHLTRA